MKLDDIYFPKTQPLCGTQQFHTVSPQFSISYAFNYYRINVEVSLWSTRIGLHTLDRSRDSVASRHVSRCILLTHSARPNSLLYAINR